ncbi:MAG: TAXI family TRAP transporter solute-binding subunit [Clostridia bacterium]|jgi:TRAP transporter TAXI family solute receptor|nr:TAXI family TRAP transporter solute-binding subunit [Clostridia bacterium]MCI1999689.1 TAXI family TRAP transporter solute-binding subunit [Clostridia bacterium]MCI2013932.1 TAXI family TRAP transporter solute-binding subunit [Clostridia bacterium]
MKKKLAVILSCAIALMMFATGCGNSSSGSASQNGSAASGSGAQASASKQKVTLGTGGTTGTYYAVGGVMATVLNPKLTLSDITVTSTGASKANIQMVEDGEADLATVQNDVMYYAYKGTDLFKDEGAYSNFSAVAGLYAETCQIIATSDIKSVADLKGKTVSVGDAGSGVEFNARQILAAYGLTFDDIKVVNASFGDSADSLKDGKIDAAFVVAGAPTTAVTDLSTTKNINIVSIDDEHADKLIADYPFYTKKTIPAGTYKGVDTDVPTVSVRATLIASNKLSEDVVYELTKALFENKDELVAGHSKFGELSLQDALNGIQVPIHPGAEKYYKEQGIIK